MTLCARAYDSSLRRVKQAPAAHQAITASAPGQQRNQHPAHPHHYRPSPSSSARALGPASTTAEGRRPARAVPHKAGAPRVETFTPCARGRPSVAVRDVLAGQIFEARMLVDEGEVGAADGPVACLADDDLRDALHVLLLPPVNRLSE